MVQLTPTTLDALLDAVRQSGLNNGRCVRLVQQDGAFGLTIDAPTGWDTVVQHEGTSVLVLSREVQEALGEAVIEAKEDDGAFQLIVRKPDQTRAPEKGASGAGRE